MVRSLGFGGRSLLRGDHVQFSRLSKLILESIGSESLNRCKKAGVKSNDLFL